MLVHHKTSLFCFLAVVIGLGWAVGWSAIPDAWYANLTKPGFNPPNWIFAPVWTLLYVLVAVAGWRVWLLEAGGPAMKLWGAQFALNLVWSPVFFRVHALWGAAVIIAAMLVAILSFIGVVWRRDRVAGACFMPYGAWVAFALLLNISIAIMNP